MSNLKFASSNTAVCMIDTDGTIMPLKAGIAVVTVSAPGFTPLAVTVTVTN